MGTALGVLVKDLKKDVFILYLSLRIIKNNKKKNNDGNIREKNNYNKS